MGTKIHLVTDALGQPLRFILTGGQVSDFTQALRLLDGVKTKAVIADKGYDSNQILAQIEALGAVSVIPSTAKRKLQRDYDRTLYKQRNRIERAFNRLKQFRRIATRYDRKAIYFLAALHLVAFFIWG